MRRRYEVSFRAELTDRERDEVADKLFELGWDDICFRPIPFTNAEYNARLPQNVDGSRADSTRDRDALRDALQHETQRGLKW
jgi:PleD family two-component response regulator